MSLATDILKHSGANLVATPRQRTQTKRGQIKTPDVTPKHKHCFCSGKSWYAQIKIDGVKYYLGSHPTEQRASIAAKLFLFWARRFGASGVPLEPVRRYDPDAPKPERLSLAQIHAALRYGHSLTEDELKSVLTEVLASRL